MKNGLLKTLAFGLLIILLSACAPQTPPPATTPPPPPKKVVPPPPLVMDVNHYNYEAEILNYPGPAIVVFYNSQFWQSNDMLKRVEWLARNYTGKAKFAKFHWDVSDDATKYKLEMLPTVILYQSGTEIDRIKGIPPEEADRQKWNEDIELWFLKNALNLKGSAYSGDFKYLFKNSYQLEISSF